MILRVGKSGSLSPPLTAVTFWSSQDTEMAHQRPRSRAEAIFAKAILAVHSSRVTRHSSLPRPYVCKNASKSLTITYDRLSLARSVYKETFNSVHWPALPATLRRSHQKEKRNKQSRRRWICEKGRLRGRDSMRTRRLSPTSCTVTLW